MNVQRFRGGLVCKAHRRLYHPTLGVRVIKKKKILLLQPFLDSPLIFAQQREFCIGNLLVRIHFIIVMIGWTGLAPWEFECPFFR